MNKGRIKGRMAKKKEVPGFAYHKKRRKDGSKDKDTMNERNEKRFHKHLKRYIREIIIQEIAN